MTTNPSIMHAVWVGLGDVAVLCVMLFVGLFLVIKLGKTGKAMFGHDKH